MKNFKKIFITGLACGTLLTGLAGCQKTENPVSKNEDMTEVEIYHGNYSDLLGEDIKNQAYNIGFAILDDEVLSVGDTLPKTKIDTYNGETIDTPEGSYVLEILGSWCHYCQQQTKESLQETLNKGIKVYQYFPYGTKADVDSFYQTIEMEIPEGVTILLDNADLDAWLESYNYTSVPMTFPTDENGKITIPHIGYMETQSFEDYLTFAFNSGVNNVKVGDETIREYIQKQKAIKEYIDSLEKIEVPSEILN